MLGHSNLASGDTRATSMLDKTGLNGSPVKKPPPPYLSRSTLKRHLRRTYGRRPMELVKRYFRSMFDLADYASYAAFLLRCRDMRIVPRCYRVECPDIKYTRHVLRILDECSYRLMLADLDYHRLRKLQLSSFLERVHERLEKIVSPEDLNAMVVLAKAKYNDIIHTSRVNSLACSRNCSRSTALVGRRKTPKRRKKGPRRRRREMTIRRRKTTTGRRKMTMRRESMTVKRWMTMRRKMTMRRRSVTVRRRMTLRRKMTMRRRSMTVRRRMTLRRKITMRRRSMTVRRRMTRRKMTTRKKTTMRRKMRMRNDAPLHKYRTRLTDFFMDGSFTTPTAPPPSPRENELAARKHNHFVDGVDRRFSVVLPWETAG
ncbi:hypothetical protein HPB48_003781 [Haemaphysalis longicornis]|uniref:Uncharacterized protein n=1 Tax=Haemaphysalis longicornis TaxID=44386 RepID=A0A9J6FFF5_HAELO|nr:hypothetical protein HPB48_003781 [Haemaphysalis longicornis]